MPIDLQLQASKTAKPSDVMQMMLMILLANDQKIWREIEPILEGRTNNGNPKMDGLDAINCILAGELEATDSATLNTIVENGDIDKNSLNNKLANVLRRINIKVVNGHIAGLITADEVEA